MNDPIDRQAAIDAFYEMASDIDHLCTVGDYVHVLEMLPSAQPEITLESAIDYLHSIGWMQEHDRILSSTQPEIIRCKDCKYRGEKPIADGRYWCEINNSFMYYCSDAERRTDGN